VSLPFLITRARRVDEVIVTKVPQYVAQKDQQTEGDPEILRQRRNKRREPLHMAATCGSILIMIKSMLMLEMKDRFQIGVEKRLQKRGKNSTHDGTRRVVHDTDRDVR
jgi:hypothetical protein